mgnify:CR=1 FL=1
MGPFRRRSRDIAHGLPPSCGGAALFEVTNPGQIQLQELGCFLVPGVQTQVLGGFKVGDNHLYVGDRPHDRAAAAACPRPGRPRVRQNKGRSDLVP